MRLSLPQIPLRKFIYTVCAAAWFARFCLGSSPMVPAGDAGFTYSAASHGVADEFVHASTWAERWGIVEEYGVGARIFGILAQLFWGAVFPNDGPLAFALNNLLALVTMLALAGAARHLHGDDGRLFCLLFASVSPLFLNYSSQLLVTMGAATCLCLALFFFTRPCWKLWDWGCGGLCLGLAFGTHYGAATCIIAVAAGLGISVAQLAFFKHKSPLWRLRTILLTPVMGAASAAAPLLLLEVWARTSGGSYFHRLETHERLVREFYEGPYGLWLREYLELDPLHLFVLCAALFWGRGADGSVVRWRKAVFVLIILGLAGILLPALPAAGVRTRIALVLILFLSAGCSFWRVSKSPQILESKSRDPAVSPPLFPPLGESTLIVSALVLIVIYTFWRKLSHMPRLTFLGWPLLVLTLSCLFARIPRPRREILLRRGGWFGLVFFLLALGGEFGMKGIHQRVNAFASRHEYLRRLDYQEILYPAMSKVDAPFELLGKRAQGEFRVIGPPNWIFPNFGYEEDPERADLVEQNLRKHGLDRDLNVLDLPAAQIFFEERPASSGLESLPPPGTPLTIHSVWGVNTNGATFFPQAHSYRGTELQFPPWQGADPAAMSAIFSFPAERGKESAFGFEYLGIAPNPSPNTPTGAALSLTVFQRDRRLGEPFPVPLSPRGGKFQMFKLNLTPESDPQEVRVEARLVVPEGKYCPPVSCYFRRPFLQARPPKRTVVSGFAQLLEGPQRATDYFWDVNRTAPLDYANPEQSAAGRSVRWKTAPLSGKNGEAIVFAGSVNGTAIHCRLLVNGQPAVDFQPISGNAVWQQSGYKLEYLHLNRAMGVSHGIYVLTLPDGAASAGQPLELSIALMPYTDVNAWFGLREIPDAARYLN